MIQRLVPHPFLTALLTAVWMLLENTLSWGVFVFALILGLVIPFLTRMWWPNRPKLSRPFKVPEYLVILIWDIIVANVSVAITVVFKRNADMKPAWIAIPLDIRSPEAITCLASTITLTPGTVSADVSSEGAYLLVHCLDTDDPDAVRDEIKSRYERRLKEIFE
ncbi:Na+/H+ antiporter subunit E [Tranquillimonas rosea]|uniref:Na+/H+ antiporter subunit E n=1 Tax=Tranquillimonas rosea TaxID=641238 RepID=UPI003BAB9841